MKNVFDLWPALDLRQLAAFDAVAQTGSFAQAAKRLGYTQPAVSHQLATLERLVGHRLIDRTSGRNWATLTPAGRVFARHAATLASGLAALRGDLEALAAGDSAVLRVGAFQSVSARILPPLLQELAAAAPRLSVELAESADESELLAGLADGSLDFAFVLLPIEDEQFEAVELLSDPFCLVGAAGDADALAIGSLRDLADVPLVAPRTCRSWAVIESKLREAGVEPRYAFRTDDNLALKALVQRRAGLAFLSELTLELIGDGLATAPADRFVPPRRLALAWHGARTQIPHRQLFVDLAQRICRTVPATAAPRRPASRLARAGR